MFKIKYPYLFFVIPVLFFFSCKKEKAYWDDDLVAPIASSSLSLSNIFPDTILKTNTDSSLKIAFETDLFKFSVDSVLKLPDTTLVNKVSLNIFPFNIPYSSGQTFPLTNGNGEVNFSIPNGIQLHSAIIRSGQIRLEVRNTLTQPTIYRCIVNSAKLNNVPLTILVPMAAGTQANPSYSDTLIDVSNYNINFTGATGNKVNTIVEHLDLIISNSASPDSVRQHDSINSTITFINLIPQFGLGYFGNQTISVGPDTTVFDIFNKIKAGNLNLNSASFQLNVINDFGVEMKAKINSVRSINSVTNNTVALNGSVITSSFHVNAATQTGIPATPVISSTKTLNLNNTNSNIVPFINNLPDKISYDLTAQMNPNGNISGANDFAFYGTSLRGTLNVDIPLNFSASNITLKDTTAIDFSSISQFDNVNYGNLILNANNSFPFSVYVQGYLLDENSHIIDSLFTNQFNTIDAGILDANNKVVSSKKSVLKIPLNQDKMTNLKKAKKVYFVSKFNTANQPAQVKFYNYYSLDLNLTVDVNYSINK